MKPFNIFFSILFLLSISACDKNQDCDTACPQNASCFRGSCQCYAGYEGTNCTEYSYKKFEGYYNVYNTCTSSGQSYNCSVYWDGSRVDRLTISQLFNDGMSYYVYINQDYITAIEPAQQTSYVSIISSDGSYNATNKTITIRAQRSLGGQVENCQLSLYK